MPLGIENFVRQWCKRSRRGLYGGKMTRFGNNVSEKGGNKTRRTWKPNVQRKTYYSEILDRKISLRCTTYVIRWIDKVGGFDNYILKADSKHQASDLAESLKIEMEVALMTKKLQELAAGTGVEGALADAMRPLAGVGTGAAGEEAPKK
eukprot:CAMPEP_0182864324 /NCGR_PEP_ID=MMETSP0034_2-20130328/7112_1 /TAXON_ID=156128 /ORGANISM="Nephroselmis pyriformis, Strain CCMP717" /LENGTH=148 /DNA_ID=CAMNT_0024996579 /DNA_START=144 /DNA_END=587 /DNA_ORIENTATION=+